VIDGNAYAGESLIERLKPGEERFISFAVDLATLVTVRNDNHRDPVFLVRVVNGTFQAHYYQAEQKTYVIANQTDKLGSSISSIRCAKAGCWRPRRRGRWRKPRMLIAFGLNSAPIKQ